MSALPPKTPAAVTPFSDALGYRVLGFDKKSGDRLEMLRLRPQLATVAAFEAGIRERQRLLVDFRHTAFSRVRQIDRPAGQASALAIVSNYVEGQRLSDVLKIAETQDVRMDLVTAACLLRQIVTAVAVLHEQGEEIAHGTLCPERIVVTAAGRIAITEYVVGAGLAAMKLTPQQAWQDYRLALPATGGFDRAADVYQLGYLGLTLVYGRSIYDRLYPPAFAERLEKAEEITPEGRPQALPAGINRWIGRALQLDGAPFATVADAQMALDEAIASAGLVATPDVVVELLVKCNGEPAAESVAAPAAERDQAATVAMPALTGLPSADHATSASSWSSEADAPPHSAHDSGSTPAAASEPAPADSPVRHRLSGSRTRPFDLKPGASAPSGAGSDAPAAEKPAAAAEPDPVAEAPLAAAASVEAADQAKPAAEGNALDELPPAVPYTPPASRREGERPLRSSAAIFRPASDTVAAEKPPARTVRKLYFVALGMAVVMAAGFELALRYFNPFGGTPAKAISATDLGSTKGTLSIDSTPQARVFIDDAPQGTTPLRLDLDPGQHVVRLEAEGHGRTFQLNVIAGKEISQVVELSRTVETGTVDVRTDPPGARVVIDGKAAGVSPLTISDLKPGAHSVVVEGPNGSIRQVVQVAAGATASIVVPLGEATAAAAAPVAGFISVESPEELQIYSGGRLLGSSRTARHQLPAGTHDIELRSEAAGFTTTRNVAVQGGKVAKITVQLPDGSLSLNAVPWAEVWLDGTRIGETPIGNVTARAGTHELVFRHPQHGEIRQTVVVKAGEIGRVTVNMTR